MNEFDLAWLIIDSMIGDYVSREEAEGELGNLDDLALNIVEVIERLELKNEDGITYLKAMVDQELF